LRLVRARIARSLASSGSCRGERIAARGRIIQVREAGGVHNVDKDQHQSRHHPKA
jgi:hypothetical protein